MALSLLRCGLGICTNRIALTKMINVRSKSTLPGGGGGKQTESEMKFNPGTPSDKFINRRKTKFYERFASTQGKTGVSLMIAGVTAFVTTAVWLSRDCWYSSNLIGFYEHQETKLMVQPKQKDGERCYYYVSGNMRKVIEKVKNDLNLPENESKQFVVFSSDSVTSDCILFNNLKSRFSAAIGVPFFTNWSSNNEVDLSAIKHKSIFVPYLPSLNKTAFSLDQIEVTDSNVQDVEELKSTLVLSDKAKSFMLASLGYQMNSHYSHAVHILAPSAFVLFTYSIAANFNELLRMFEKPLPARWGLYMATFGLTFATFVLAAISNKGERSEWLDLKTCSLGQDYAEGGVEYYEKAQKRGQLIRKLLPDNKGELFFEESGEPILYFFDPPTQESNFLSKRLERCRKIVEEYNSGLYKAPEPKTLTAYFMG